jgi:hypothetical protein
MTFKIISFEKQITSGWGNMLYDYRIMFFYKPTNKCGIFSLSRVIDISTQHPFNFDNIDIIKKLHQMTLSNNDEMEEFPTRNDWIGGDDDYDYDDDDDVLTIQKQCKCYIETKNKCNLIKKVFGDDYEAFIQIK